MLSVILIFSRLSDIKGPQCTITLSFLPKSPSFSKPIQQTISLSEMDPGYKLLIKATAPDGAISINHLYETICAIWCHLYNLKSVKNTSGEVLLLVHLQAKAWVFFTFFKL